MQPGFVPQQQPPQQFRPQLVRATFAAAPMQGRPVLVTQVPQGRPVGQYTVAGPRPVLVTQAPQARPVGGGGPVGGFVQQARPFVKGFGKGGPFVKGGFDDEDRSRDWHCPKCRERNFVKRATCFRCGCTKPADCQVGLQEQVKSGQTLNGMVKSYNRKGFGFLMIFGLGDFPDVYYTRENLSPKLETRDIPGQHVTFEILRMPDGKMIATSIRPLGEDISAARAAAEPSAMVGKGFGKMGGFVAGAVGGGGFSGSAGADSRFAPMRGFEEEDRSRDWECSSCGERNFVKRLECFRCKTPRSQGFSDEGPAGSAAPAAPPARRVSPHAGSRAMAFTGRRSGSRSPSRRSRSRRKKKKKKKDKKKKKSSSSSSGSSEKKDKKKKKNKKRRHSDSSSEASAKSVRSDSSSEVRVQEPAGDEGKSENQENPEIAKAKGEALDELLALKGVEPVEARMKEWRALLRKWHPDKNPDRSEVATAVFQFLQKGKPILENK